MEFLSCALLQFAKSCSRMVTPHPTHRVTPMCCPCSAEFMGAVKVTHRQVGAFLLTIQHYAHTWIDSHVMGQSKDVRPKDGDCVGVTIHAADDTRLDIKQARAPAAATGRRSGNAQTQCCHRKSQHKHQFDSESGTQSSGKPPFPDSAIELSLEAPLWCQFQVFKSKTYPSNRQ